MADPLDRHRRRTEILGLLASNPLGDRIRIFGSCATPGGEPVDVDLFVEVENDADRAALPDLLYTARQFYGEVDPFVLAKGRLYTRSPEADGFVPAKRGTAAEIAAAGRAGVPLREAIEMEAARGPRPPAP